MICHRHRVIFIHQRKAAGRSIIDAFGYPDDGLARHNFNDGTASGLPYRGLALPTWDERPRDYLVFTVVRNPYDRLVSAWAFLEPRLSFLDMLRSPPMAGRAWRHFTREQSAILPPDCRVLRYESLQDDFRELCQEIGKEPVRLKRVGQGERRPDYRTYYCDEARRLVEDLAANDLREFGYAFDPAP